MILDELSIKNHTDNNGRRIYINT